MTFESAFTFIYSLCLWISSESTKWVASESGQTSFYICTSFCSVERENTTKIESARAPYAHIWAYIYMPAQIKHLHSIKLWCWEFGFPNPVCSMFPEGSRLLPLLLQSLCTAALLKSNASSKIGLIIPRLNIFSQPLYATRETHLHLSLFCVGFLQTRPLPSYKCRHLGWRDGIWGISRSKNLSDRSIRSRVQVTPSNTK